MAEHTPGPWNVIEINGHHEIVDQSGEEVGAVLVLDEITKADAVLMSAAPNLLAACEGAALFLRELGRRFPDEDTEHAWVLSDLEVAISKAKGE